jgi:predicted DNA-binding mobile mystery protein A
MRKLPQLQQLSNQTALFWKLLSISAFSDGWIKTIRTSLGMTMQQLGNKLNVSKQNILEIERRELEGNITLKSLRELGNAMDMQLIYGFAPKDGSIEAMIERKAMALATKIVMRASQTMKLEGQENSKAFLEKAIQEKAIILKLEIPKALWD